MGNNIKRKTIVFNMDDPFQRKLHDHCSKFKNFSYYGKSLIQNDVANYRTDCPDEGVKIKLGDNVSRLK